MLVLSGACLPGMRPRLVGHVALEILHGCCWPPIGRWHDRIRYPAVACLTRAARLDARRAACFYPCGLPLWKGDAQGHCLEGWSAGAVTRAGI